jgi:dipeptidase
MNEHQVAMVMNACRSRRLLRRASDSCISHFQLMRIALERARTAREAIGIMGSLVERYGLLDIGPFPSGKNIGVIDPTEAWWFNAPGGHQWAAKRVPDNAVSVNANRFWLEDVDGQGEDNFLCSPQLVTFAIEQGWHDPASGRPFSFVSAYGDNDGDGLPGSHRVYSTLREWRVMSLVAGCEFPVPVQGVEWPGPHIVVPAHRLSLAEVFAILRDHYAGTPFDTTRPENGGGEYGCPHPPFEVPTPYPRPIDMFNTQISYVARARSVLDEPVGGSVWFAFHSPSTGCYVPFYPAMDRLPPQYGTGDARTGAFWRFFALGALIRHQWRALQPLVREAFDALEHEWIGAEVRVDAEAISLLDPENGTGLPALLSAVCTEAAQQALQTCEELTLLTRANLARLLMQETLDEPTETLGLGR